MTPLGKIEEIAVLSFLPCRDCKRDGIILTEAARQRLCPPSKGVEYLGTSMSSKYTSSRLVSNRLDSRHQTLFVSKTENLSDVPNQNLVQTFVPLNVSPVLVPS